jgi:hypothetical protein
MAGLGRTEATPPGFGRVANVVFEAGSVRFIDARGTEVRAAVDHAYLRGSDPPVLTRPG